MTRPRADATHTPRHGRVLRVAATAAVVTALAAPAGAVAAAPTTPVAPAHAQSAAPAIPPGAQPAAPGAQPAAPPELAPARRYNACLGYADFARWNPVRRVLADTFTWRSYDPVKVGDGTGNISWRTNPYRHVSWYMWLHSLRWLGGAIDAGRAGDARALRHAKAIARDWVRDNPYSWKSNIGAWESTMHRTNMLLCLRNTIVDTNGGRLPAADAWLTTALLQHARFMVANFSGLANHGTDESLALLGVGTTLGRPEFTRVAQQRLTASLGHAIDAQGGTNEQATGYAVFNAYLWQRAASEVSKLLPGSPLARQITARRDLLLSFVAHSITPAATLFQLGNTEASRQTPYRGTVQEWPATGGRSGRPPRERAAAYTLAGFAFGRDTWGTSAATFARASAYALRFGARQARHGHDDHTSLTWYADGAPVLIDPGYGEYTRDAWQAFATSAAAHNVVTIAGMSGSVPTSMTRRALTGDARTGIGDYYQLVDRPGAGFTRVRDVLVMSDPEVVVVADRAQAPRRTTFTQWWHLPARLRVTVGRYAAVAANSTRRQTTIMSLPFRGQRLAPGTVRVTSGSRRPVQGWWWPSILVRHPAPAVSITRTGRSAAMLTLIAYIPRGTVVSTRTVAGPAGSTITTVRLGRHSVRFGQSAGGSLYRIR